MNRRIPILIAVAGKLTVWAASWAVYGWNVVGAHVAARNTARFSALWFLVGFALPGVSRWIRALPSGATLIRAFVAAHLVHFATVAALFAPHSRPRLARSDEA